MSSENESSALLERFRTDPIFFAETFCRVVDMSSRERQGSLVPFRVGAMPMQRDFVERVVTGKRTRAVELKARRVGGTTLFMILGMASAMLNRHFHAGLIAQNEPEALRFGRMWKEMYANMVPRVRMPDGSIFEARAEVGIFADHMIEFPKLGSFLLVGTVGSTKLWLGQSLNYIIGTEVSKWDVARTPGTAEQTWAGVQGALVPGGFAVLESTAFGAGGFFYNTYMGAKTGENGWYPLFYDWRWHPLYALEPEDPDALEADRGPVVLTDLERTLGLTEAQARWRRFKIASTPGSTYDERLALFLQEYPEDDVTCFAVSGNPFFSVATIDAAIKETRPLLKSAESGALLMWQAPRVGESYVVGVDPGGEAPIRGDRARDFAAAVVVDSHCRQVAALHGQWDTRTFAELVAKTADYYNKAHVIVESGAYGDAVLLVLTAYLRYPNLYVEKDEKGRPRKMGKATTAKGFGGKPAMADNFKELFETGTFRSDDRDLLSEMRNFHRVPTPTGRIALEAIAGHDDRVMAAMLALWAWSEGGWRTRGTRTKIYLPGRS